MRTVSPTTFASSRASTVITRAVFQFDALNTSPQALVETPLPTGVRIWTFTLPCGCWPNCTLYVAGAPSVIDKTLVTVAALGLSVTSGCGGGRRTRTYSVTTFPTQSHVNLMTTPPLIIMVAVGVMFTVLVIAHPPPVRSSFSA